MALSSDDTNFLNCFPRTSLGMYAFEAAFLRPGEEVIMFEPFFDQYLCNTTFQNGVPVFVAMTPPSNSEGGVSSSKEWKIDIDKLRAAITPKTKMMSVVVLPQLTPGL